MKKDSRLSWQRLGTTLSMKQSIVVPEYTRLSAS